MKHEKWTEVCACAHVSVHGKMTRLWTNVRKCWCSCVVDDQRTVVMKRLITLKSMEKLLSAIVNFCSCHHGKWSILPSSSACQ